MANSTTSVLNVNVEDTGDEFHEITWTFRGRTYWACADNRVRYQERGQEREITARAALDLSTVDWRLGSAAYLAEIQRRVRDWLVAHHRGGFHVA